MNGLADDTGDGSMLCTEHPFKNNTPAGGICAFCLQEKLGKLVSSSFPIAVFPSSSSSSSSFRSDTTTTNTINVSSTVMPPHLTNTQINNTSNDLHHHHQHHHYHSNGSRILYLLGQKKKKKKENVNYNHSNFVNNDHHNKNLVFKRSKSTASHANYDDVLNSPHKSRFWSFLHLQKHNKTLTHISSNSLRAPSLSHQQTETNETPRTTSFGRKVSRSRSVGCGSRSFSGDFFERISTFGDCTLRRVESQREGKNKLSTINRCGGLFSGFMITSSSSSSSNWIGSNHNEGNGSNVAGKVTSSEHSRSRSWGWVLASPMRGFSKPLSSSSSSSRKNEALKKKNQNPNLNAIPSLLSVS